MHSARRAMTNIANAPVAGKAPAHACIQWRMLEFKPVDEVEVPTKRHVKFMPADPWISRHRLLNAICSADLRSGGPSLLHHRRRFCGEVPGRFSHFLERARLDLPNAFTRHVESCREVLEGQWVVG